MSYIVSLLIVVQKSIAHYSHSRQRPVFKDNYEEIPLYLRDDTFRNSHNSILTPTNNTLDDQPSTSRSATFSTILDDQPSTSRSAKPSTSTNNILDDQPSTSPVPKLRRIIVDESLGTYIPSSDNGQEWPSEKLCREILEQYFSAPFPKKSQFIRNPRTNRFIELDGYCQTLRIAFEYQGEQHYHYPSHWIRTKREFASQVFRDQIKTKACKKLGIYLIVVPYTAKKEKGGISRVLYDYLLEKFPDKGVGRRIRRL